MRWTVALQAEGDREITLDEVVELADAVAGHQGVASGMGTNSYGAQVVVEAPTSEGAIEKALDVFSEAAARAGLPVWPVVNIETAVDEAATDWYEEIPEGQDR
ncbi:MAG TPA: hypothetical protein VFP42_03975 [Acidimicrobiia bacterium]|jgi:hypothetical protein|nr:hypothetical protein [Acidimicrobiia bacterium]